MKISAVIVGAGISGLMTALEVARFADVAVCVPPQGWTTSSTYRAQGGIAVALGADDYPHHHYNDTVRVGRGLCHEEAVDILTKSAPTILLPMIEAGIFAMRQSGIPALGLEAGHSHPRIVHAPGGLTGQAIAHFLYEQARRNPRIRWVTGRAIQLITNQNGHCLGVWVRPPSAPPFPLWASATVLATGGYAALWHTTTNPATSIGHGHWLAYQAGAELADLEFVQFHPTVLAEDVPRGNALLLTEALRGIGAHLLDPEDRRFMLTHPQQELAPRDEVARAIFQQPAAYLSLKHVNPAEVNQQFGELSALVAARGYELSSDRLPVHTGAHYCMGGIRTDVFGQTTVQGLYAVGEAAHTGVHGANRLASNSLLEGLVFGQRVGYHITHHPRPAPKSEAINLHQPTTAVLRDDEALDLMGRLLDEHLGVIRTKESITQALAILDTFISQNDHWLFRFAMLIARAAYERTESRGAHFRADAPETDPEQQGHFIQHVEHGLHFTALTHVE
ncbi:MAG: aspartate oxidase [Sulfobacillus thermosulfidooxidans]|nr:MAG: aspartate oxidase [Sulfobacillus thermosulfidooxidans]